MPAPSTRAQRIQRARSPAPPPCSRQATARSSAAERGGATRAPLPPASATSSIAASAAAVSSPRLRLGRRGQLAEAAAVERMQRDPDARGQEEVAVVDPEGGRHQRAQLAGEHARVLRADQRLDQRGEAARAQPGQRVGLAEAGLETGRYRAQQAVAERAAHLLDHAEIAVELDRQQRQMAVLPLGARGRALEALLEKRPVGQAGQLVVAREADLAALLQLALDRGEDRALHRDRRGQALRHELLRAAADRLPREQDVLGAEAAVDHDRDVRRPLLDALDGGEPARVG
ncbi:MAG: hypothetical protein K0R41_1861 [Geminicoccaceae bacterium]|nr:hypothetical protein [Geminicoccaceae bacterium]